MIPSGVDFKGIARGRRDVDGWCLRTAKYTRNSAANPKLNLVVACSCEIYTTEHRWKVASGITTPLSCTCYIHRFRRGPKNFSLPSFEIPSLSRKSERESSHVRSERCRKLSFSNFHSDGFASRAKFVDSRNRGSKGKEKKKSSEKSSLDARCRFSNCTSDR